MDTNSNNYRPALAFYHANAKGTGCAVKMTLHPATADAGGYIELVTANQATVGNRLGPNPTFPTYDRENAITTRLDFDALCLMLQVFRGETESVNDGRGIYIRTTNGARIVRLRHILEPICGYVLEVNFAPTQGGEMRTHIVLTNAEALGICEAISGSLYLVSFGVPVLIPHE